MPLFCLGTTNFTCGKEGNPQAEGWRRE